jgi:hypothetical protein
VSTAGLHSSAVMPTPAMPVRCFFPLFFLNVSEVSTAGRHFSALMQAPAMPGRCFRFSVSGLEFRV